MKQTERMTWLNGLRKGLRFLKLWPAKAYSPDPTPSTFDLSRSVLVGLLLLVALIYLVTKVIALEADEYTQSFIGYYTASVLLLEGNLGPQVYDNDWFIQQVQLVSQQPVSEIFAPSLPTVVLVGLPFAWLPLQTAHALWLWSNLLVLCLGLAVLVLACRRLKPKLETPRPLWEWGLLVAFALVFRPTLNNFEVNQSIFLFFGLFTLTLWGLLAGRDWLAGLSLGLAFVLKTTGLSLWFLLLVQRRWRALIWGWATIIVAIIVTMPWIGLDTWLAYLQALMGVTGGATKAVTAYQSTAGLFTHLFQYDPIWNPHPVYHWPLLAQLLTFIITLVTLLLTLWLGRPRAIMPLFFAALLPLSLILLPVASEQHMVILLISIFILVDDLHPSTPADFFSVDWLLLSLGILLLMLPIPYKDPRLSVGWLALLAYPRLYGSWLIWVVAIRRMRRAMRVIPAQPK